MTADVLGETLFVKDGPLLLRAALSRLIVPIRDFVSHLRARDRPCAWSGSRRPETSPGFMEEYRQALEEPGDYFLPSVRFVVEEISGSVMSPGYRNRVSYGAKGRRPHGPRPPPRPQRAHRGLRHRGRSPGTCWVRGVGAQPLRIGSYRYPNALIPLVLANSAASIARRPSGDILSAFADQLMRSGASRRS